VLVVADVADDLLAVAGVGPQPLVLAALVARDHRVGRGQDGLCRAVVLLEHDRGGLRVVPLELLDVADRGAAERVDGLIRVAHHAQLARLDAAFARADQFTDQHVLGVVGVLVLVDQHVPEAPPVVLGDVRERLQQLDRLHDQVVEVEGVRLRQAVLVDAVHLGDAALEVVGRAAGRCLVVDQLVLEVRDLHGQ
jgi:hypothetical protein